MPTRTILISIVAALLLCPCLPQQPAPTPTPTPTHTPPPIATLPLPTFTLPPTITHTSTPPPSATATSTPTATIIPSPTLAEAQIIIVIVNKQAEYVDIRNIGGAAQDLIGWHLLSERGSQDCLLAGILQSGQTLRIWARAQDVDKDGYNCGHPNNIWNNQEPDAAILYDVAGNEISRQ